MKNCYLSTFLALGRQDYLKSYLLEKQPHNPFINMKFLLSLALFLACLACLQAQPTHPPLDSATLAKQKEYTSIEEALKEPLKVYKLNLANQGLNVLPKEISKFKNLQILDCSRNSLIYLPSELTALLNLIEINCRKNLLQGLPLEIGKLYNLKKIYCHKNYIIFLPSSLCNLDNLEVLDCSFNEIKQLPKNIGNMKKLKYLDVWSNEISVIPTSIGELKNIKIIDFSSNPLSTFPKELEKLQSLREFKCQGCQFQEQEEKRITEALPKCIFIFGI